MGSARIDTRALEDKAARQTAMGTGHSVPPSGPLDLKQQAAERIRAHRERRSRPRLADEAVPEQPAPQPHNPIAAAVAERYAQTPTYRAFLAEQAQRAMEQAKRDAENAAAEAEIAARNAEAVAQVQKQLLAELELWDAPQEFTAETAEVLGQRASSPRQPRTSAPHEKRKPRVTPAAPPAGPVQQISTAGLTVRLYEDIGATSPIATPTPPRRAHTGHNDERDLEESLALDEEILFRQAPVFEPFDVDPPTPLPANLLEFPRQLVAARKARPRLAEGPLVEEEPRSPQLRIFEVEPEQIATAPTPPSGTPEWADIHLDAQPATRPEESVSQAAAADAAASATPLLASNGSPGGHRGREHLRPSLPLVRTAVLHVFRSDPGHALRAPRTMHSIRRKPDPRSHSTPHSGTADCGLPLRSGYLLGASGRRRPGMARPDFEDVSESLLTGRVRERVCGKAKAAERCIDQHSAAPRYATPHTPYARTWCSP